MKEHSELAMRFSFPLVLTIAMILNGCTTNDHLLNPDDLPSTGDRLFHFPDSIGNSWLYSYSALRFVKSGYLYSHQERTHSIGEHTWTVTASESLNVRHVLSIAIDAVDTLSRQTYEPVNPPQDYTPVKTFDTSYVVLSHFFCTASITPDSILLEFSGAPYLMTNLSQFRRLSRVFPGISDTVYYHQAFGEGESVFLSRTGLLRNIVLQLGGMTGGATDSLFLRATNF